MVEEQFSLDFTPERRLFTVSELNAMVRGLLASEFADIWVAGEISGVKPASSGHYYFTLKDQQSQLRCVCFRNTARYLRFKPQDGVAVVARGRLDVYEPRGEYQLLVEALEPQGYGALQLAFEQLKKRLSEEGLFDPARKRPLPRLPRRIGIVTSPAGAVIQDIIHILDRRLPGLHIRLYPVQVQGAGAADEVVEGIDWFSNSGWPDVVIVARGGGSLEDLWTFNEEAVARAIARCRAPLVSAIGHETDTTIADFVADLRAPTPSAAAELIVPARQELLQQAARAEEALSKEIRYVLAAAARRLELSGVERAARLLLRSLDSRLQRVDEAGDAIQERLREQLQRLRQRYLDLDGRLARLDPRWRFAETKNRLAVADMLLRQAARLKLVRARGRLESVSSQLAQLSPLAILERGYAVVQDQQGRLVRDAAAAPVRSALDVTLARGRLRVEVTRSIPGGNSELPS